MQPSVRLFVSSAFTLLLASCGGGGSSNGNKSTNISTNSNTNINESLPPESNVSEIAYIRTSQARPKPGSVTQSSNTKNGITTDTVSIQNNTNNIVLSNTTRWSTTIPKRSSDLFPFLDSADKRGFPFWVPYNSEDITLEFREEFSLVFMFNDGRTGSFNTVGSIRETDYLTLGTWAKTANTGGNSKATSADIEEIGLYVTGGNVFSNNIQNLTGNATYSGPVMALIVPHNVPLTSSIDGGRDTLLGLTYEGAQPLKSPS